MTASLNAQKTDEDLATVRTISTVSAVVVGLVVSYAHYAYVDDMAELFRSMNLTLPIITRFMTAGISNLFAPGLTLLALALPFLVRPDKAIRGQAVLILFMFGFSLMSILSLLLPLRMLIGNLG
jgi:hypothetical protein